MRIIIFCLGILISWLSHQRHNYPSIEKIAPRNLIIMDGNNNCQHQGKQFSHWLILCISILWDTCGGHFVKDWKVYHSSLSLIVPIMRVLNISVASTAFIWHLQSWREGLIKKKVSEGEQMISPRPWQRDLVTYPSSSCVKSSGAGWQSPDLGEQDSVQFIFFNIILKWVRLNHLFTFTYSMLLCLGPASGNSRSRNIPVRRCPQTWSGAGEKIGGT